MSVASGAETRVNTYTTNDQASPQITALSDGGWVVTWISFDQDGSNWGIYQQAYQADGTPQGSEAQVNTYTTLHQSSPQTTALPDGGWVVTWQSYGQDGSDSGIYQQAYQADSTPQGGEIRVNTYATSYQSSPQITALSDGGWVVTWHSSGQDGSGSGIYQQVYQADGTPQGGETRVNTYATSDQSSQQTAALPDGGWVVTWQSYGQDGSLYGVYQQAYEADGTPQGGETRVNTYTASSQLSPQIAALPDGGWVVTWQSYGQDGADYSIYQQAYQADGTPQGGETRVNTYTANNQSSPQTTALPDGGWVVTWLSYDQDGSFSGIYQQAYQADGTPQGGETRVNAYTTNEQTFPQITALSDGGWVVTWQSYGQDEPGSGWGIYQQAYQADGTPQGSETQVNAYTMDNQSAPQITALPEGSWVVTWQSNTQDGGMYDVYQRTFWLNDTPTVDQGVSDQTATEDSAFAFTIDETAFADADTLDTLTYSATLDGGATLPAWLSFDAATRTFSGTPANGDVGAITVKVTATDVGGLSVSDTFTLTVGNTNDTPTLENSIADQQATEDSAFSFTVDNTAFADVDAGDTLAYSATLDGGGALPAWLSFDATTRTFSGTPANGDVGAISVKVTATDAGGLSVSDTFTLTVENTNDAPVHSSSYEMSEVQEDTVFAFDLSWLRQYITDDDGDELSFSVPTADRGVIVDNYVDGTFRVIAPSNLTGIVTLNFDVSDNHGGLINVNQAIKIVAANDTPTQENSIADQQATEDSAFSFTVDNTAFADVDAGDTLTYSATLDGGGALPAWLTFDATTRTFSGTPANGNVGAITIKLTATDAGGLSASTTFSLSVENTNDAPVVPVNTAVSTFENAPLVIDVLSAASDDDGDTLTVTAASVLSGFGSVFIDDDGRLRYDPTTAPNQNIAAGETRTVVIRYTVSDGNGGTASPDITVTVKGVSPDIFKGTTGNDTLTGSIHGDILYGYAGKDTLDGKTGADQMRGGTGDDTYVVDNTADTVIENANEGSDLVKASVSHTLAASVENLTLTGSATTGIGNTLANILTGNDAANTLDGKAGADRMIGGKGNDTYVIDNAGDVVVENTDAGTDLVKSSVSYTLTANVENLTLTGSAATGIGNTLANILTGNDAANTLDGKAGADRMIGGKGNDTYIVDNVGDVVVEGTSAGTDLVKSSVNYTLTANVENLALTGLAKLNGTGNTLANILTGNDADNVLDGKAGADRMVGGKGSDTYIVDNAGDVVVEGTSAGTDLVKSSVNYTLGSNVENLTLTGAAEIGGYGNGLDNIIIGNNANNIVNGGSGTDTLIGGAGNDRILAGGGAARDKLYGGTGADVFVFTSAQGAAAIAADDRDIIFDFSRSQGDKIDLKGIDANTKTKANDAFSFIQTDKFHKKAGELRYEIKNGDTYISGDTNGDGTADFSIKLDLSLAMKGSDFIL